MVMCIATVSVAAVQQRAIIEHEFGKWRSIITSTVLHQCHIETIVYQQWTGIRSSLYCKKCLE